MNSTASQSDGRTWERAWLTFSAVCIAVGVVGTRLREYSLVAGLVGLACSHLPVLLGAWTAARRLRDRGPSHPIAAVDIVLAGQIYVASIIATGICLGLVGWLTPGAVTAALAMVGALLLLYGGDAWRARRPMWRGSLFARCITAAVLLVILLVGYKAVTDPEYVYDVLTYHLFFPARWVQDGRLSIVPTWCGGPIPDYAPSATEVYYAMLMLPIGGDAAARSGQFPFWVLLIAAVWALARELGLPIVVRAAVTLLVALLPRIAMQAATAMVDVALAAHLVCIALFAIRVARRSDDGDVTGLLLALGMLAGTKFLSLTLLIGLIPLLAWAAWRCWKEQVASRGVVVWIAAVTAIIVGPSWYVRNWLVTGNPLYPVEVNVAGLKLFDGVYGRLQLENTNMNARRRADYSTPARVLYWGLASGMRVGRDIPDYENALRMTTATAGVLLIGAAYLWAVFGAIRRSRREPLCLLYLVCSGASLAAFWCLLPFQDLRFSWGPVILCMVGAATVLRLSHRLRRGAIIAVAIVWAGCMGPDWSAWMTRPQSLDPRTACWREKQWATSGLTTAWDYVDREVHRSTIAYVGNNVPYFLLGRRFENRVLYVPARRPAAGCFHDYAESRETRCMNPPNTAEPAVDRFVMGPQTWLNNLRELHVDYVLVNSMEAFPMLLVNIRHDGNGFPIERKWMEALCNQGTARRVASHDGAMTLYRLEQAAPGSLKQFPTVIQEEVDAIDQMRRKEAEMGYVIPEYPLARDVIEERGLAPP